MTSDPFIYKSSEGRDRCIAVYDAALSHWPVPYEQFDVPTHFGNTHVIASGPTNAPPLVLLHGNWATATMWSCVVSELSRDHRTLAIDQIDDVGKSAPTRLPASRIDYAEWLLDVFDHIGLPATDIAGLSYGGFLALNAALYAPERVKRLILLSPGVPSFGVPTRQYAIHGMPLILFPSRLTSRWLVQRLSVHGYCANDLEAEQLIVSAINLCSRIPFRPAFDDSEFAALKLPVLLLIGEREILYDARLAVDRARQLIPHIEAEIIPQAGHMLSKDQPNIVNERMRRFLA